MRNTIFDFAKGLARKHYARWSRLEDALHLLHASDDGGRSTAGEQSRRLLMHAQGVSTYPSSTRNALKLDRANALAKVAQPLAEALGHIITIELAEERIRQIDEVENSRWLNSQKLKADGFAEEHVDFIAAMHELGVSRGHYTVLRPEDLMAIGKFILRKYNQRVAELPRLRTDAETHGADGKRKHTFWNANRLPFPK
jgi:hypothetical protein